MAQNRYALEVQPVIPERLARLTELADNLVYSWDRRLRGLFVHIDPDLWERCGHSPKVFLRRVDQQRLDALAQDRTFLEEYHYCLAIFDSYHEATAGAAPVVPEALDPQRDLIAYFCAEYGLHESLRLYSGGLGVLAGDLLKTASDMGIPYVAVGLLYRQGYFTQTIDAEGEQQASFQPAELEDLPISPASGSEGKECRIAVPFPGREVAIKVWCARIGHVPLYLLDTDLADNAEADRAITYQLYGGGEADRIAQEIVLGIGGVRALRALGHAPTAWHLNEGHPAFAILERCREMVAGEGLDFDSALELVAASTVFTTHTPVAAGHDLFDHELTAEHFRPYIQELGIGMERLLELGDSPGSDDRFNMTALALRGSRHHNGVSAIHGRLAAEMNSYVWPQLRAEETPFDFVTNGVHVPTFLAREWVNLFDMRFQGWRNRLQDADFWDRCIESIPDHRYWSLRQSLKTELLGEAQRRLLQAYRRNKLGPAHIDRMTAGLSPAQSDVLVLGFARRFTAYKRGLLLFRDAERLARLLNDPRRPVILIFAGKAHPNDEHGQELIRAIHDYARQPEFMGKVFFLEDYDIALARKLVTGVDVWINTPQYPLEASGTSGQKAAINGVLNLSVLDGWWAEGHDGRNGWGIPPHGEDTDPEQRDRDEAEELLDILEHEVIPLFYRRGNTGYPRDWVARSKASMKTVLPRFNSQRMMVDYLRRHYVPAIHQGRRLAEEEYSASRDLAAWKARVRERWPEVGLRWAERPADRVRTGEALPLRVAVTLGGLETDDVCVECLLGDCDERGDLSHPEVHRLEPAEERKDETIFGLDLGVARNGLVHYEIRIFPQHPLQTHPYEMGLMRWL